MYPRSGVCSGGTYERTLVPVFVLGEHAIVWTSGSVDIWASLTKFHWGHNYYIPLFFLWIFPVILTGILQHAILGGISFCNVTITPALPWKPRKTR